MNTIKSAKFIKGVVADDEILEDEKPQIAIIGRSNVGKSSLINSLTRQPNLARTSQFPGRTREINVFLINNKFYFIDLPGYGFARGSGKERDWLFRLINWYFFKSSYKQKIVILIMDANIGPSEKDLEMLHALEEHGKKIIIVANKIDKIKKNEHKYRLQQIQKVAGAHKIIPYSSEKGIGIKELTREIFK
jgi:GTP-binding protein